ncbi:MAG: hypothetical protein E7342_03790 [Clostridiales bacterium]|nr:hypothetical protein [Clostridiales bacterium]
MTKEFKTKGLQFNDSTNIMSEVYLNVYCTNDERGKTVSINNGKIQFTFDPKEILDFFKEKEQ